jgi:hypothetical protein
MVFGLKKGGKMKCERCGYEWRLPGPQRGGMKKHPAKGFGTRAVLDRALATLARKKVQKA